MTKRCYKCKEERQLEAFSKNQTKCKHCAMKYNAENKDRIKAYNEKYYKENSGHLIAYQADYREKNPSNRRLSYLTNREKEIAYRKIYVKENPWKITALNRKRQAQKLQATPKWMTAADFAAIQEWYRIAKELQWLSEEKLHVDHIVPLQGKDVCGLHVPWNLQILPASENISKGNRIADHVVKYESTALAIEATGGGL